MKSTTLANFTWSMNEAEHLSLRQREVYYQVVIEERNLLQVFYFLTNPVVLKILHGSKLDDC